MGSPSGDSCNGSIRLSRVDSRINDIRRFYELIAPLAEAQNGLRLLGTCRAHDVPRRGAYFFFEEGERRSDSGEGLRVVRVGTHGISEGSKTSLWQRLSQHRGTLKDAGGNHRGSIFRLIVGEALAARNSSLERSSWGHGSSADRGTRLGECELEGAVSAYIRAMPFVCLGIDDDSGKSSLRARIETNAIALLSNFGKTGVADRPSESWLGRISPRPKVRDSGLWNSRDVDSKYDPDFLDDLEMLIAHGASAAR